MRMLRIVTLSIIMIILALTQCNSAVGVSITAAGSGSNGISILDNDNLDMGVNDFGVFDWVAIPDYTPSADIVIAQKTDGTNGYVLSLLTTGKLRLTINTTNYDSTATLASVGITDFSNVFVGASVTRSSEAVAGSVVFYVSWLPIGSPVAISAGAPVTVNNAEPFYLLGTSSTRTDGLIRKGYLLNFAPSAADVLLMKTAIPESWKWGNQTITNYSAWTGATGATPPTGWGVGQYGTFSIVDSGDGAPFNVCLKIAHNGTNDNPAIAKNFTAVAGKKYRIEFYHKHGDATNLNIKVGASAGATQYANVTYTDASWSKATIDVTPTTTALWVVFTATTTTSGQYELLDELNFFQIGVNLALEPSGIKSDKWYDSSTNDLDASYPAVGSNLIWSYTGFSTILGFPY